MQPEPISREVVQAVHCLQSVIEVRRMPVMMVTLLVVTVLVVTVLVVSVLVISELIIFTLAVELSVGYACQCVGCVGVGSLWLLWPVELKCWLWRCSLCLCWFSQRWLLLLGPTDRWDQCWCTCVADVYVPTGEMLGEGSQGSVRTYRNTNTNKEYAVKVRATLLPRCLARFLCVYVSCNTE